MEIDIEYFNSMLGGIGGDDEDGIDLELTADEDGVYYMLIEGNKFTNISKDEFETNTVTIDKANSCFIADGETVPYRIDGKYLYISILRYEKVSKDDAGFKSFCKSSGYTK